MGLNKSQKYSNNTLTHDMAGREKYSNLRFLLVLAVVKVKVYLTCFGMRLHRVSSFAEYKPSTNLKGTHASLANKEERVIKLGRRFFVSETC